MNSAVVESPAKPRRKWWLVVALVFSGQLALIFSLSDHSAIRPRAAAAAPTLHLAGIASADLLALMDPTLFALPRRQGFSGPAWLKVPEPPPRSFDWVEPPRGLALAFEQLGAAFEWHIKTNEFNSLQKPPKPEPELTLPERLPVAISAGQSVLRLEGVLAGRRLLTPVKLRSWEHTDILTNTIVKLAVDAKTGEAVTATLLPPGCGYAPADMEALSQARAVRFEPAAEERPARGGSGIADLIWVTMIFEWNTLPVTPTNAPPGTTGR